MNEDNQENITPTEITEELQSANDLTEEADSKIGTIEESEHGKIKYISIEKEMKKSYLDYAMSVIVSRALPDVRDGLKPVHRRILYSMHKSGIHHTSAYKKSARIVGDVLGKYHPHGDTAVYYAMVRLAQDFSMRYPLVDGQGNYGSVDGDSPAAMRYTEARMAKITAEILQDIDKNTVDFRDNFDGSLQEPTVLPAKLPNLLLMGSEGIAVGMATKIPPHNLNEVGAAILTVLEKGGSSRENEIDSSIKAELEKLQTSEANKDKIKKNQSVIDLLVTTDAKKIAGTFSSDATIDDMMEHIKGPDFPTGGIIYDRAGIKEGYKTGKGRVIIRSKASIEESARGGHKILVTELPYQVNKSRLLMKIANLVKDKKITGIKDLNDDSDRTGMQITIELKKDARPKVVLNKLFKYSELQTSFPMNMVALTGQGTPQLMNVRQILMEYIVHRQITVVRRSQYQLIEARDRAHILEGLLIALDNLDEVIETIRRSADTETAKQALMEKFSLSEVQSLAILDMQLKRLAALERKKIESEYTEVQATIEKLIGVLAQPKKVLKIIDKELQELMDTFGDERKTQVINSKVGEFNEMDLVPNEEAVITLTESGYIKRLNPSTFRAQSRGGKGSIGLKMKAEDMVKHLLTAKTHDTLLLFTSSGRVFALKAFEIPEVGKQAKGTAVVNLINILADEKVQSIMIVDQEKDAEKYITLATKNGLVKKSKADLFFNIRQSGIIAITLNDDDKLVYGKITSGEDEIILVTYKGKCIRFSEKEVKASNRDTKGVKGITLSKHDYVVGVEVLTAAKDLNKDFAKHRHLLIVSENGMGKKTLLSQYPLQKRSGKGLKVAEITKKSGNVAAARKISEKHKDLVISTLEGQTIKMEITKKTIPSLSRATQGVILMRLNKGDQVTAVALTYKEEEETVK